MRRVLSNGRWNWIADSFLGLRAPQAGQRKDNDLVEACRFFGTSAGHRRAQSISRSLQKEIVDALCLGERNRASHLLVELGSGNQALRADDFSLILQYCARMPDPIFVMQTWKLMEQKDVEFSGEVCIYAIRALSKGGYLKEAFSIINFLQENSEENAVLPVYNLLLKACMRPHRLNYANECLHLMERQMSGKNEITYTLLLKLAVLQRDLSAVKAVWKECLQCYSLSALTLRKFIWSFTRLRDLDSAYEVLQQMIVMSCQYDFSISKISEEKLHELRLDIPIPFCKKLTGNRHINNDYTFLRNAPEYFMEVDSSKSENSAKACTDDEEVSVDLQNISQKPFPKHVRRLLRWSFSDIIHACASTQNIQLAEKLMSQMQNLGLKPSCSTYDGFIKALLSVKGFSDGMEVLRVMQQKDMKPHDSTLAALSASCSGALELDLAQTFLDQLSQYSHAYPYNAFLEACNNVDQPERALWLFAKMRRLKILPDIRTYELLFSLFGNVNAPYEDGNMWSQVDVAKRINAIEMDMMRHGIQHSHLSMQNLLKALGMEGMVKELIQHLHATESNFFLGSSHSEITIYNTVLHSLVEAKESDIAIEIFRNLVLCGFPRNETTYTIMIDCCSTIKSYQSACALVSMMIRDGFFLHSVSYTALIKILLELEDFVGALEILHHGCSEGIKPDVVLYNTILQATSKKGRIDVMELILERMQQEEIQPDPSTCSHVFSAYVYHGFHSTAMEALQVLSLRMISLQDDILEEIRLEYEDLVLNENLEAESMIIEIFKNSGDLTAALLCLRWCAMSGFPVSWLPNQSQWVKRLSSDYGSMTNEFRYLG